jgi:hypothetical protein
VPSSLSQREGEEGVVVDKEKEEEDPVKVIPVPDSLPRSAYRQTMRI